MTEKDYSSLRPLTERLERQRGGININENTAGCFAVLALCAVLGLGVFYDYFQKKKFAEEVVAHDSGTQIAYLKNKSTICFFPIDYLKDSKEAKECPIPGASIDGLVWDAHGTSLVYLNNVGHIFNTKHQIVSYDHETGVSQVIFDLRDEQLKLTDDDIEHLWLVGERVFFELGDGGVYSFRSDDPSLKAEKNAQYKPQDSCPDGGHIVKHVGSDDSDDITIKSSGKKWDHDKVLGHGTQPVWSPKSKQ